MRKSPVGQQLLFLFIVELFCVEMGLGVNIERFSRKKNAIGGKIYLQLWKGEEDEGTDGSARDKMLCHFACSRHP